MDIDSRNDMCVNVFGVSKVPIWDPCGPVGESMVEFYAWTRDRHIDQDLLGLSWHRK